MHILSQIFIYLNSENNNPLIQSGNLGSESEENIKMVKKSKKRSGIQRKQKPSQAWTIKLIQSAGNFSYPLGPNSQWIRDKSDYNPFCISVISSTTPLWRHFIQVKLLQKTVNEFLPNTGWPFKKRFLQCSQMIPPHLRFLQRSTLSLILSYRETTRFQSALPLQHHPGETPLTTSIV